MNLSNSIGLKHGDVISIVGAGGKTTLMFRLAKEIKNNNANVLVTTTTKIYLPSEEEADIICIGEDNFSECEIDKTGIYVYGLGVNSENKVIGLGEEHLDRLVTCFDYTIIEADGSKCKPLKGWNNNEPVVYKGTTKTIGVLDIQTLGMEISDTNIHRVEEFSKLTHGQPGEKITVDHLLRLIIHPMGLFKNNKGEKILFINKADDSYHRNNAMKLVNEIQKEYKGFLDRIVIGSLIAYRDDEMSLFDVYMDKE